MKFLVNRKLATRIGIITTCITLAGMLLLWRTVSDRGSDIVKNDITNQMTDAAESRAAIISDYVSSAEEYRPLLPLAAGCRNCSLIRTIPRCCKSSKNTLKILRQSKAFLSLPARCAA